MGEQCEGGGAGLPANLGFLLLRSEGGHRAENGVGVHDKQNTGDRLLIGEPHWGPILH